MPASQILKCSTVANVASIGSYIEKNPESILGNEYIKFLVYAAGGLAILGLFTASAIGLVLVAGATSGSIASAGGLGVVVAVCANHPITAAIVTGLVSGVSGTDLPQDGVKGIVQLIARLASR
jgi:hypothetical protein